MFVYFNALTASYFSAKSLEALERNNFGKRIARKNLIFPYNASRLFFVVFHRHHLYFKNNTRLILINFSPFSFQWKEKIEKNSKACHQLQLSDLIKFTQVFLPFLLENVYEKKIL